MIVLYFRNFTWNINNVFIMFKNSYKVPLVVWWYDMMIWYDQSKVKSLVYGT